MLRLPATVRVFLCLEATDMRRSFDGLTGMVAGVLHEDPLSGHLFVFRNKNGDRLKVLYWDRDGLVIFYKRLERGAFRFPTDHGGAMGSRLEVPMREFAMILEGFELAGMKKLRRFCNRAG
jgi:transposase